MSNIFAQDFYEYPELWNSSTSLNGHQLVQEVERVEKYTPIVEDISLDDDILCQEVNKIEQE